MSIDAAELEPHRTALIGHCYRMLGSVFDAEDAVQETMVRAWQSRERFEGRASIRTWLYRIATNVCLDALSDRSRRARPMEEQPPGGVGDPLETRPRTHWLEPIPDARALPADTDPHELTTLRQSIRLAFVAALQHLPPKQRAALLLSEVLGWSAAEVADCLETSTAAINSALQRARATLAARQVSLPATATAAASSARAAAAASASASTSVSTKGAASATPPVVPYPSSSTGSGSSQGNRSFQAGFQAAGSSYGDLLSEAEARLLDRYVDAFHRYDIETLVALLREDATMSMPPLTLWLRGPASIAAWLLGPGIECRGSRLVPTRASGGAAFGQYRPAADGGFAAWALIAIDIADGHISGLNYFLDTDALFPLFGLPPRLPAADR